MPYDGGWYIPCRVAEARFWGNIVSDDLDAHNALCIKVLTEAQEKAPGRLIHMLLDLSEVKTMPPLYLMISRAMPVIRFRNRDTMFLVTRNNVFRSILEAT